MAGFYLQNNYSYVYYRARLISRAVAFLWAYITAYHYNAAIYGQNKHAYANLRQTLGLEQVVQGLRGLTQLRLTQTGRKTAHRSLSFCCEYEVIVYFPHNFIEPV